MIRKLWHAYHSRAIDAFDLLLEGRADRRHVHFAGLEHALATAEATAGGASRAAGAGSLAVQGHAAARRPAMTEEATRQLP